MLGLALVAGVVGALLPGAATIAAAVSGACLGSLVPQPKTWGANPAAPQAPASEVVTTKIDPEKR